MQDKQEVWSQEEIEVMLRQWFYVGQEITQRGIRARVIGFGKKYIQRGGYDHKRAGEYVAYNKLRVRCEDGCEDEWNATCFLSTSPADVALAKKIMNIDIRLCALPDTLFWVGDIVEYRSAEPWTHSKKYTVVSVDYDANGGVQGEELYGLQYADTGKWWGRQHQDDLKLVTRGNARRLEHGEPLDFEGEDETQRLLAEAKFHQSLGMSQKIPCLGYPDHGMWQLWAAVQQIQLGNADQFKVKDKKHQFVVLIKYDNRKFGERLRKHVLESVGLYEPAENAHEQEV